MEMSQYLCIVAGQRAGTTALQGALGSTGKFFNFSEIFHTEPPNMRGTFLEFCQARDIRVADMATEAKTEENCARISRASAEAGRYSQGCRSSEDQAEFVACDKAFFGAMSIKHRSSMKVLVTERCAVPVH